MKRRTLAALTLAATLTGCTILPTSPGWDPTTGWMQWDLELDNGTTGRWTSCLSSPEHPAPCGTTGQHTWTPTEEQP